MTNKREIEVRGADVEKAIEEGLQKLGLKRSDVIIDVVDEGSRGLLGIGSRDAVVRLMSLTAPPSRPKPAPKAAPKPVSKAASRPNKKESKPAQKRATAVRQKENGRTPKEPPEITEADPEEKTVALEMLNNLLDKMSVEAELTSSVSEPDDLTGRKVNVLEVEGEDLGVLIGPRGETLNAIQYLSRLMVGNQMQQRASFVIDVEGYRKRRQQALSRLAERMAQKVVTRQSAVSLEPMPPHERRIIHMTLRDNDEVYTQSSGEGKRRKVRILPR